MSEHNETPAQPQAEQVAASTDRINYNGKMLVSFTELITLLFVVCGGVLAAAVFILGQIGDLREDLTTLQTQVTTDSSDFVRESDTEHWTRTLKSDFDAFVEQNEQRLGRHFSDSDARHWNATERFFAYQDVVCGLHTVSELQESCQTHLLAIATCLQEQEKADRSEAGDFRRFGKLDVDTCLQRAR